MNVDKLAEKLMDELDYYMDGYYLSGDGRKEITNVIKEIINKEISQ